MVGGGAGGVECRVRPGGTDTPPFNGWGHAATNIQVALNAAVSGDVVFVTNAWCPLEAELIVTQYVELRSWNDGALDPAGTSLDGQAARRCMYLNRALVSGFTLSNGTGVGTASSNVGGAVYMAGGTLSNCVVAGNSANTGGGGVYVAAAQGVVANCRVEGNVQTNASTDTLNRGGGIYAVSGGTVRDCTVALNTARGIAVYYGGGGIFGLTAPNITGCLVVSNSASSFGGGIQLHQYNGQGVRDCTMAWNSTAGTYGGGGLGLYTPVIGSAVFDCQFMGNTAGVGGGGGVGIVVNSAALGLVLSNCVAERNVAAYGGGYAVTGPANPTNFSHDFRCYGCSFSSNRVVGGNSAVGGGCRCYWTGLYLESCTIRGNTANNYGGALFANPNMYNPFALRNCLVADNVATGANGVAGLNVLPGSWVDSCTVVSNYAAFKIGGLSISGAGSVTNSIIYHNSTPTDPDWTAGAGAVLAYCCVPTSAPDVCVECITGDPALVGLDNGDYRLTVGSPCVDRGTNETWMETARDLAGKPRVDRFGRRVDIGAYEVMPAGTLMNIR